MNRIKKSVASGNLQKSRIHTNVAEISSDYSDRLFSVGFRYFDDKICVLKSVNIATIRKVHEVYRRAGQCLNKSDVRRLPFDIKPINNSGHYTKYFSKVTQDTEVHEFDAGSCRGFFFFDEVHKILQILAINHHPENKKNKK